MMGSLSVQTCSVLNDKISKITPNTSSWIILKSYEKEKKRKKHPTNQTIKNNQTNLA